jgi:hypothetical protein
MKKFIAHPDGTIEIDKPKKVRRTKKRKIFYGDEVRVKVCQ